MEERNILARNIKRLRDASSFTQEQVASFLNITRSAYSNYESAEREIPFSVLEKLSDLYGCDMYELYSEDDQAVANLLATAFRVDSLSAEDMEQLAAFKRIVKHSLKMDILLEQ